MTKFLSDSQMKILLICHSIGKDWAATSHVATELIESLSTDGHEIFVWAVGNSREYQVKAGTGIVNVQGARQGPRFLSAPGPELILLLTFCFRAMISRRKYELAIWMDSPRLSGIAADILKKRFGTTSVAWVMDLPFEQIFRRSSPMKRFLARIFKSIQTRSLKNADKVVTLGACMKNALTERNIPREHIKIIGSWAPDKWREFQPAPAKSRSKFGLKDQFTIMYSGFAGVWHDFEVICDALTLPENDKQTQWLFSGSGPGIDDITTLAEEHRALNIVIRDRVERKYLQEFLSCGDVHIVSLGPKMEGTCVPSKLYPLMALGIPVIFIGPRSCQTAIDIERATAGIVCQTVEDLLQAITKLKNSRHLRAALGMNAKKAFQQRHCLSYAVGQWKSLIELNSTELRLSDSDSSYEELAKNSCHD
jgi:glycosyltransferase involved in cell wall biosynthesis